MSAKMDGIKPFSEMVDTMLIAQLHTLQHVALTCLRAGH